MVSPLGQTWLEAAQELGFRVTAPFVLKTKSDTSYQFDALVHDFGGERGMVLMEKWESEKADAAAAHGYGYSSMSAGPFDREATLDALRDWGWCGKNVAAPSWLNEKAI